MGALVLDGMIRSTLTDIERDLQASYRGGSGAQLRKALDANVETMVSAWKSYLDTVKARLAGANDASALDRSYASAVHSAIDTWSVSLVELKRLLNARLSYLLGKLRSSLLLNGLLVAFSLAFAVVTGRHIVQPLLKLEAARRRGRPDSRTTDFAPITKAGTRLAGSRPPSMRCLRSLRRHVSGRRSTLRARRQCKPSSPGSRGLRPWARWRHPSRTRSTSLLRQS